MEYIFASIPMTNSNYQWFRIVVKLYQDPFIYLTITPEYDSAHKLHTFYVDLICIICIHESNTDTYTCVPHVGNLSRYPFLLYRASYLLSLCPQVIFVMPVSWFANPIKITSRSNTSNFKIATSGMSWQWRHNERDGVSNIQPHECLLNRLFKRRSKKTAKLCVIGLCAGNSQVTGDFPAPTASNA